jgi:hypothetical protein
MKEDLIKLIKWCQQEKLHIWISNRDMIDYQLFHWMNSYYLGHLNKLKSGHCCFHYYFATDTTSDVLTIEEALRLLEMKAFW